MEKLTKEVAEKLSVLREEIYDKAKEYNKLAGQYVYGGDLSKNHYADEPVDPIIVFEGQGMHNVEPEEATNWLPSMLCY